QHQKRPKERSHPMVTPRIGRGAKVATHRGGMCHHGEKGFWFLPRMRWRFPSCKAHSFRPGRWNERRENAVEVIEPCARWVHSAVADVSTREENRLVRVDGGVGFAWAAGRGESDRGFF